MLADSVLLVDATGTEGQPSISAYLRHPQIDRQGERKTENTYGKNFSARHNDSNFFHESLRLLSSFRFSSQISRGILVSACSLAILVSY